MANTTQKNDSPAQGALPAEHVGELMTVGPRWVVMLAVVGSESYWAWCQVSGGDGYGFENIFYTETDGFSPADPGPTAPQLRTFLFAI